jgi:hypothetical protein
MTIEIGSKVAIYGKVSKKRVVLWRRGKVEKVSGSRYLVRFPLRPFEQEALGHKTSVGWYSANELELSE